MTSVILRLLRHTRIQARAGVQGLQRDTSPRHVVGGLPVERPRVTAAAHARVRRVAWSRPLGVERTWTSTWRDRLIPLLLLASALLLYIPRLETPSRYLFDEIIHAYTAGQYVNGNPEAYLWDVPCSVGKNDEKCVASNPSALKGSRVGKYEWVHPPLGRHLIAAGILLFGDDPFGWRIASVIAGASGIVLAY